MLEITFVVRIACTYTIVNSLVSKLLIRNHGAASERPINYYSLLRVPAGLQQHSEREKVQ